MEMKSIMENPERNFQESAPTINESNPTDAIAAEINN